VRIRDEIDYYIRYRWGPWPLVALVVMVVALVALYFSEAFPCKSEASVAVSVVGKGTVVLEGRAVTGPFKVARGSSITLRAVPAACWYLDRWVVNGSDVHQNPLTLKVQGDTEVVAVFEQATYTLRVLVKGSGDVIGPANQSVPACSKVTLRFVPEEGWVIAGVLVNGVEKGSVPQLELVVNENVEIRVTFVKLIRVRVRSNVEGALAYINGDPVSLPYEYRGPGPVTIGAPLRLNATFKVPRGNGTYTYWFAWYEVNGTRYSYYGNRTIVISNDAEVELHFIPGLTNLPYVLRVYLWPPTGWVDPYTGMWYQRLIIKDGALVAHDFNPNYNPLADFILEFAPEVEKVYLEFWSEGMKSSYNSRTLGSKLSLLTLLAGQSGLNVVWFQPKVGTKYLVVVTRSGASGLPEEGLWSTIAFYSPPDFKKPYTMPGTGNVGLFVSISYEVRPVPKSFRIFVRVVGAG